MHNNENKVVIRVAYTLSYFVNIIYYPVFFNETYYICLISIVLLTEKFYINM